MSILEIIEKKKHKKALTRKEIYYFVNGYCNETIKDYQISSLLMAIRLNGMNEKETYYLTNAIIDSGKKYDLSKIKGITVDKHSTGGVGDKTSLVVVPLLASLGFKVAKMSGRGLGHTGGTIDKLNSIPGFNCELSEEDFINQVNSIGCAIISQSKEIALADKKLYALRDVSGSVDSLPLIASSIMGKKIAMGSSLICLDVKFGNGALFKSKKAALEAAKLMIKIGKKFKVKVKAVISDMNQPLGNNIGNYLEVIEALETLKGNGPKDLENICKEIAKLVMKETDIYPKNTNYDKVIAEKFTSLEAYNKLLEMINAQHGNLDNKKPEKLLETLINSDKEGYISKINTLNLGNLLIALKGGRTYQEEEIDYDVGFTILNKLNDKVKKGTPLFKVYSKSPLNADLINEFKKTITITDTKLENYKEIYKII